MRTRRCSIPALLGPLILSTVIPHQAAFAAFDTRLEAISFTSMLEAQGSTMYALNQLGYLTPGSNVTWSGTYSETGWTSVANTTLHGRPFTFAYQGVLNGTYGSNISTLVAGSGFINNEDYSSTARQTFFYDSTRNDYRGIEHVERGNINPWWVLPAIEVADRHRGPAVRCFRHGV